MTTEQILAEIKKEIRAEISKLRRKPLFFEEMAGLRRAIEIIEKIEAEL